MCENNSIDTAGFFITVIALPSFNNKKIIHLSSPLKSERRQKRTPSAPFTYLRTPPREMPAIRCFCKKMNMTSIGIVDMSAAAIMSGYSVEYSPSKLAIPTESTRISAELVMTRGHKKSFHEARTVKIPKATRAGFAFGRMMRQ